MSENTECATVMRSMMDLLDEHKHEMKEETYRQMADKCQQMFDGYTPMWRVKWLKVTYDEAHHKMLNQWRVSYCHELQGKALEHRLETMDVEGIQDAWHYDANLLEMCVITRRMIEKYKGEDLVTWFPKDKMDKFAKHDKPSVSTVVIIDCSRFEQYRRKRQRTSE